MALFTFTVKLRYTWQTKLSTIEKELVVLGIELKPAFKLNQYSTGVQRSSTYWLHNVATHLSFTA